MTKQQQEALAKARLQRESAQELERRAAEAVLQDELIGNHVSLALFRIALDEYVNASVSVLWSSTERLCDKVLIQPYVLRSWRMTQIDRHPVRDQAVTYAVGHAALHLYSRVLDDYVAAVRILETIESTTAVLLPHTLRKAK